MTFNSFANSGRPAKRCLAVMAVLSLLTGCAALPSSGPTGTQIRSQIAADANQLGITLVQVETVNDLPRPAAAPEQFRPDYVPPPPTELVGPGDVLNIAIFETGIALFGQPNMRDGGSGGGFDPSARSEQFPPMRVSDEGTIRIPFIGSIYIAGKTTAQIETQLRQALRGKSQNPQVLVSITEGLTNSVIVGGDISRPGRLVLPTNRESLSDVIALAGGNKGEIRDLVVRVARNDTTQEFRFSDVLDDPALNIRVFPSDRITLIRSPRSFSVLGAAGQTNQFPFSASKVSLIEAVAMAGGANPMAGNARAIFVFRIERDEAGKDVPIVYHFNMMEASSYILAQRFDMQDKDVVYVGNALANQPTKMIQLVSQLFLPFLVLQQVGAF